MQKSEDLIYILATLEIMQWKISKSLAEAMIWIYEFINYQFHLSLVAVW